MADQIFEYTPEIDQKVERAVSETLNEHVKKTERISQGEDNYVYKVKTNDQIVMTRVARYKDWPRIDKLLWISKQLIKTKIPHAKILFSDTSSEYFKFGFMIVEWIEGDDGMSLIKRNKLSRKSAVKKIAKTLSSVHKIKVKGFGEFDKNGKGKYKTWENHIFSFLEDPLYKRAVREKKYKNSSNEMGVENMKKIIKQINYKSESVLTHQDPTPENAIFNNDKAILIDWDDAVGSSWIEDLAWITFWMGQRAQSWFLETHKPNEPLDLIKRIERIIHLKLAITLLPYFLYLAKNDKNADRMNKKIRSLVLSEINFN